MRKYNFDIEVLKSIARHNIDMFEETSLGDYNFKLCADERLSFPNEGGMVLHILPFDKDSNVCYILNYYVSKDLDFDHDALSLFEDLEDWEQDIIFESLCKKFNIDCNNYLNPCYYLLKIVSNADFYALFNFIQSNKKLKKIFDAKYKKGYKWFASSDDGLFDDESKEIFETKEECYNDMRNASLEKTKWNTEFIEDFERSKKDLENDPMDTDYSDVTIGYDIKFSPTKITHESYSGKYTYVMKQVFVDANGKVLYDF